MNKNLCKNKIFSKLICAASNTNLEQIKRLSIIYSLAGIDLIDIAPIDEVISAANEGIDFAQSLYNSAPNEYLEFKKPILMASINSGNDDHFQKAQFDLNKCRNCFNCVEICPSKAISIAGNKLQHHNNTCYGCGRCVKACHYNAIELLKNNNNDYFSLHTLAKNKQIQAIEIHTGKCNISEIKHFIEKNKELINAVNLLSYSVESDLFSRQDLIKYVNELLKLTTGEIIIQIDGKAMGANNKSSSSLQSIAAAEVLKDANINTKIQLAGGCNHLTKKYVEMLSVNISGIGYGTFARKLLLPYIEGDFEKVFIKHLKKAVSIAFSII